MPIHFRAFPGNPLPAFRKSTIEAFCCDLPLIIILGGKTTPSTITRPQQDDNTITTVQLEAHL